MVPANQTSLGPLPKTVFRLVVTVLGTRAKLSPTRCRTVPLLPTIQTSLAPAIHRPLSGLVGAGSGMATQTVPLKR